MLRVSRLPLRARSLARSLSRPLFAAAVLLAASWVQAAPEGHYVGIVPCADCPGIEQRLDLFADGVYYQRLVYRERDTHFDQIGRWSLEPEHQRITLTAPNAEPSYLGMDGPDHLSLLDGAGEPITSALPYTLYRSDLLGPLVPQLELNGLFTYMADSAMLHDCATGRRMPVAMERDYLQLERTWLDAADYDMERPLPARVEARIVERVNMEGPARPMVIVERLLATGEAAACTPPATLAQTNWQLNQLDGEALPAAASGPRSAHLRFDLREGALHVSGSTGCNRLMGTARVDNDALQFKPLATTQMACRDTMELERAFLSVLEATRSHRVGEHTLELRDSEGTVRARFDATR